MSSLTLSVMGNIDYNGIREKRLKNFHTLHQLLEPEKRWDLASDDVPMIYPYFTEDTDLKKYLINNNIFVATYWPGLAKKCRDMHLRLVPLPLDQRYNTADMEYIADVIRRKK